MLREDRIEEKKVKIANKKSKIAVERVKIRQTFMQHSLKMNGDKRIIFITFVFQNVLLRIYLLVFIFIT